MKDYWNEGPKGGYHRQCYQEYTGINKVSKEEQSQTFHIDKCAICHKDKVMKAYGKGARTREPLTLNISEFGSATLIKVLLHIDGRDTIAMEIKYHRSCYKNYVHPKQLANLEEQNYQQLLTETLQITVLDYCINVIVLNSMFCLNCMCTDTVISLYRGRFYAQCAKNSSLHRGSVPYILLLLYRGYRYIEDCCIGVPLY